MMMAGAERRVQAWDPAYVYVDLGAEFRRQHSLAWATDETAHMTFGSSRWALDYLLARGGSAYLPWRLAAPHVEAGRLFATVVEDGIAVIALEIARNRQARGTESHDQILVRYLLRCAHRIFRLARPINTRMTVMIQNRTMTLGSAQPLSSK